MRSSLLEHNADKMKAKALCCCRNFPAAPMCVTGALVRTVSAVLHIANWECLLLTADLSTAILPTENRVTTHCGSSRFASFVTLVDTSPTAASVLYWCLDLVHSPPDYGNFVMAERLLNFQPIFRGTLWPSICFQRRGCVCQCKGDWNGV